MTHNEFHHLLASIPALSQEELRQVRQALDERLGPSTIEPEDQEAKRMALRAALVEGEQSGASTPFDFEAFVTRQKNA